MFKPRLSPIVIAMIVFMGAGRSLAGEPCGGCASTMEGTCRPDPGGGASGSPDHCTISPSGRPPSEDIQVTVWARNVIGGPLAGARVDVRAVAADGSRFVWDDGAAPSGDTVENPQTSISDVQGRATYLYDEGGLAFAEPTSSAYYWNLSFEAVIQGAIPSTIGSFPIRVISYDLNATGIVDLVDFAIFARDLVTDDVEADFNFSSWPDAVNLVDFALFSAQLNASFDQQ